MVNKKRRLRRIVVKYEIMKRVIMRIEIALASMFVVSLTFQDNCWWLEGVDYLVSAIPTARWYVSSTRNKILCTIYTDTFTKRSFVREYQDSLKYIV